MRNLQNGNVPLDGNALKVEEDEVETKIKVLINETEYFIIEQEKEDDEEEFVYKTYVNNKLTKEVVISYEIENKDIEIKLELNTSSRNEEIKAKYKNNELILKVEFNDYEGKIKVIDSIDTDDALGLRNKMIIELLYATGIRVSELKNIKINDINFSDNSIKVMGKGSKERIVFFNNHSLKAINDYLNARQFSSEYLVLNNKGKQITVRGIELIIKNIIDKACLKVKVSPHTFRHTFATHMLKNGCPLKSVQELLGHASLSSTEIYTHITDDYIKTEYLKNMPRK